MFNKKLVKKEGPIENKWQDIEIKIIVKPDEISWNANVDEMALVFYLDRVIYCVNKQLDGGEK